MSFYAIVWSIWLHGNEVVFHSKRVNPSQVIELIKLRIAMWVKANWPDIGMCHMDIARCLKNVSPPVKPVKVRHLLNWCNSPQRVLKFNVDGSSRGKPGPTGIGGVMRDHSGCVKIRFSKSIGVVDSNLAELLAIR
ncbi:hypothetical protein DITRI_Ditri03aG0115400 [Diplodiscus trichospermus]